MDHDNLIRVHNPRHACGGALTTVEGIGRYADRALVMPGTVFVENGVTIQDYLDYLKAVNIGPSRVVEVSTLYDGLYQNGGIDQIRAMVQGGGKLQLFQVGKHEEDLIRRLGISRKDVYGPSEELARKANCKAALRVLGAHLNMADVFPRHYVCYDLGEVVSAFFKLRQSVATVMLKATTLASGEGMYDIASVEELEATFPLYDKPLILEEKVENGIPSSVQFEISENGEVEEVCGSMQFIAADGKTHLGNLICSDHDDLPGPIGQKEIEDMFDVCRPFVNYWARCGYIGIIGFDLLWTPVRCYLLECNARVTATSYAIAVARQISSRNGGYGIAMKVFKPSSSISSVDRLLWELGTYLFNGKTGILPFMPRLLPAKIGIMAVGGCSDKALSYLQTAERLLNT